MVKRRRGTPRAVLDERAAEILANCLILYFKNNRYKGESQSEPGKYYDVCLRTAHAPVRIMPSGTPTASTLLPYRCW